MTNDFKYFFPDEDFYTYWLYQDENFHNERDYIVESDLKVHTLLFYRSSIMELCQFLIQQNIIPSLGIYEEEERLFDSIEPEVKKGKKSTILKYQNIKKQFIDEKGTVEGLEFLIHYSPEFKEGVYLNVDHNKENRDKLRNLLNEYIQKFIDNKLFRVKQNVLNFQKQKSYFIELVEKQKAIENYGENFIISHSFKSDKASEFLFFHTLYALQFLDYLKVEKIWFTSSSTSIDIEFFANIIVQKQFIEEFNESFQKKNPEKRLERYDNDKKILYFDGKEIEIAKKSKETDPVLLLECLLEEVGNEWVYNDTLYEKAGYRDGVVNAPKNKFYFASQKLNDMIAKKTGIEDFIEFDTSKYRINPKYRKIDE